MNQHLVAPLSRRAVHAGPLSEKISVRNLDFFYGEARALKSVSFPVYANRVTAIIESRHRHHWAVRLRKVYAASGLRPNV